MSEPTEPEVERGHRRRGLLGAAVNRLGPTVIREIDIDAVVSELDVDAVAERLDINAVIERLDVNAIVERLDVDAVAQRLDLDRLMARLDVDALVQRLDVDAVAARLDIDAIVERLDVNAVSERLDVDAIVERLDVDAVAERLDLDRVVSRLDMAQLTAGATQDVALSGLDLLRRQLIRADRTVDGTVDRIIRRDPGVRPDAPGGLDVAIPATGDDPPLGPVVDVASARQSVSGHYAGPVTRLVALGADVAAGVGAYGFVGAVTISLLSTVTGVDITIASGGWLSPALLSIWMFLWFWMPVAFFGRTAAMGVVGVAVVRRDGGVVSSGRALVRTLVIPVSIAIAGLGLLGLLVGRERRALHDVAGGTVVVYDWGAREAERPATIRAQLQARVRRRAT